MSVTAVPANERFDVTTLRETAAPGEDPAVATYTCPRCSSRVRFRVEHFDRHVGLLFPDAVAEAFDDWAIDADVDEAMFLGWRCRRCGLYVRAYALPGRDRHGAATIAIAAVAEGAFSKEERLYSKGRAVLIGAVGGGSLSLLAGGHLLDWLGVRLDGPHALWLLVLGGCVVGALLGWRFPKPVYWIGGVLIQRA